MKAYSTSFMVDADDLLQEGCAAAIRHYTRYDPTRKGQNGKTMSLRSWLLYKAKRGMLDYLRDVVDPLTRTARNKVDAGGQMPYRIYCIEALRHNPPGSESEQVREGYGGHIEDENAAEPWELCSGIWSAETERALRSLSARERECIERYYARGETMLEISKSLGLGEARVSQIVAQARQLLKENPAYVDFLPADGKSDRSTRNWIGGP
jgi:RNA polymerase sigma factor (sigma-70 family)